MRTPRCAVVVPACGTHGARVVTAVQAGVAIGIAVVVLVVLGDVPHLVAGAVHRVAGLLAQAVQRILRALAVVGGLGGIRAGGVFGARRVVLRLCHGGGAEGERGGRDQGSGFHGCSPSGDTQSNAAAGPAGVG